MSQVHLSACSQVPNCAGDVLAACQECGAEQHELEKLLNEDMSNILREAYARPEWLLRRPMILRKMT